MILVIGPIFIVTLKPFIMQTNPEFGVTNWKPVNWTIALVIVTGLVIVTYYYARQTRHTIKEMKGATEI